MKFLLGTKEGMTQIFDGKGNAHPATLLSVGPVTVTQVKNAVADGYVALQVGYGAGREKKISRAQKGHFKKAGTELFRTTREFRRKGGAVPEENVGDTFTVSVFESGELVMVSGISKGKGFQGVVKRHNFSGGPRTHGQKHSEREGGSIGAKGPQEVRKGKKMPGRMGSDRITVANLKVLAIDPERNQMLVEGAVPGRRGTLLEIRAAKHA